jgi:thiamine-phosphate pyrophosphorylase
MPLGEPGAASPQKNMLPLPRLYPILDIACFPSLKAMLTVAEELAAAGATLMQYRDKSGNGRKMLDNARALRESVADAVKLIMNDRADLCLAAEYDGLHVGQEDLPPEAARRIIGPGSKRWLGVSTHNQKQFVEADQTSADYIALGPIFATNSKVNPDPVVGVEGLRRARGLTRKPLVAIGGITRANARSVIDAGADCVAVISDLLRDPGKSAEEFLRILR